MSTLSTRMLRAAAVLSVSAGLAGCGRGNGLASDLLHHLEQSGIHVAPKLSNSPISSRGGYAEIDCSETEVQAIVDKFGLQVVGEDDREWGFVIGRLGGGAVPEKMWGLGGRPKQFRLRNGAQFEFVYLVLANDGRVYLVAEYAYG